MLVVHIVSVNSMDACVLMTRLKELLAICVVEHQYLVAPVVHFVVFVHVVISSTVAAFVHFTHLSSVLVVCIVAHHLLVPPLRACSQCVCTLSCSVSLLQ
jgi:hypothetical protein